MQRTRSHATHFRIAERICLSIGVLGSIDDGQTIAEQYFGQGMPSTPSSNSPFRLIHLHETFADHGVQAAKMDTN